jgi:hypothetical protein
MTTANAEEMIICMADSYLGIAWFVELRWLTEPGR